MNNEASTRINMKTPSKHSKAARQAWSHRLDVSFAEREPKRRIRFIVNAACAARGGAQRMTLDDWRELEAELVPEFGGGLRMHGRCPSSFPPLTHE
jgi:hypothetical protein